MKIDTYISQEELQNRVVDLGKQISNDYAGEAVHIICILSGAFMFAADLVRSISIPVHMDFIEASSLKDGKKDRSNFHIRYPLRNSIEAKNVIVVEDIVDTGLTLSCLLDYLKEQNPKSLKLAALLYKSQCLQCKLKLDYYGFEIEDYFVVGYGMDYQGEYRALPYIATLDLPGNR